MTEIWSCVERLTNQRILLDCSWYELKETTPLKVWSLLMNRRLWMRLFVVEEDQLLLYIMKICFVSCYERKGNNLFWTPFNFDGFFWLILSFNVEVSIHLSLDCNFWFRFVSILLWGLDIGMWSPILLLDFSFPILLWLEVGT